MANVLSDYIENTDNVPAEVSRQLTSIRELDLQVHNAMDELDKDIKQFFSNTDNLTEEEKQKQYETFIKKCDVAFNAASEKVRVADSLYDIVEKSMRYLDQELDKLKKDLLDGDKAYIVEDIERRAQELEEQRKAEEGNLLTQAQEQSHRKLKSSIHEPGANSKSRRSSNDTNTSSKSSNVNSKNNNNHRLSHSAHQFNTTNSTSKNHRHSISENSSNHNHRTRNNSTDAIGISPDDRQKKRERKRLNSAMTIFNRNSRLDDEILVNSNLSTSSPLTPDYFAGIQASTKSFNPVVTSDTNLSLSLKGMIAGNTRNPIGFHDKSNGSNALAGAKQPVLTATDAAHAVSPNATNSDKLVLFSSNSNGDNHNINIDNEIRHNQSNSFLNSDNHQQSLAAGNQQLGSQNQQGSQLLATMMFDSGDSAHGARNSSAITKSNLCSHPEQTTNATNIISLTNTPSNPANNNNNSRGSGSTPFSTLPLSSRHDPLMIAASQAISATQNMTLGRRTSSLKASYAAVNSGRLQTAGTNQQQLFDHQHGGNQIPTEVYCKCRSHIQGSLMIACDNSDCKIEWFHYECVGITSAPEGEWYCDDCSLSLNIQKKPAKQAKLEGVNVN